MMMLTVSVLFPGTDGGWACEMEVVAVVEDAVCSWSRLASGFMLEAFSAVKPAISSLFLSRREISQTQPPHIPSPSLNSHPVKNPQLTSTPLYPPKNPYIYTPSPPRSSPPNHIPRPSLSRIPRRHRKRRPHVPIRVVHLEVLARQRLLARLVRQVAAHEVAVLFGLEERDEVDAAPHLFAGEFAGHHKR